jgi:hypothetical protein
MSILTEYWSFLLSPIPFYCYSTASATFISSLPISFWHPSNRKLPKL